MIDWLDEAGEPNFPNTCEALDEPNGLLAAGGRLTPKWLDKAYRSGIFPWNDPDEVRLWWSPAPRAIISPDTFRVPRTVKKLQRRHPDMLVTVNQAFDAVIEACAEPRSYQQGTWIDDEIIAAFQRLYNNDEAVSVEIWDNSGCLAGGFYGLIKGQVFFGESMFSRQTNASKLAFAAAAPVLFSAGIRLIDCQMHTDHLAQFGAIEVERHEFETRLARYDASLRIQKLPAAIRFGVA